MDAYSNLMDKVIYQTIMSKYATALTELMTSYITPQPAFAMRGNSMLESAYGANPFITEVECDKLDISPIVFSNGQAQFGDGYDVQYTFSNFGNEWYSDSIELNRGDGQRGIRSQGSVSASRIPGIRGVVAPREDVNGSYGDDTTAYQRLRFKYSRTLRTIYTEQGKRIKMRKHNKSVNSNRHNISTVVVGDVSTPVFRFIEVNHQGCIMTFLDHIIVPVRTPKYVINYLASEQFLYVLGERLQEGETSIPCPVSFEGGYLSKKYSEGQVVDILEQQNYAAFVPGSVTCTVEQVDEWRGKDVIAKLPMILRSSKYGVLNGYEVSAHKSKECVFSFFDELEQDMVSVIYDAPLMGTRVLIDSMLNSIYGYYDNLRFTPTIESIYVKFFPALYAVSSQMYNIGFLTTEFEEYNKTMLSKIKRGALEVKGINDNKELELYIDGVFKVLHEISGMYSRPTNRKYRSNKVMAWMTCGGFGANIRRITELVAYSGLDVTSTGKDLINLELIQLSLSKDKGEGVYNLPVGYCGIRSVLSDGVAAEKMIKDLRSRSVEVSTGINLNGAKSIFFNDTGRTCRIRYGSNSELAADQIESSTIVSQLAGTEALNRWLHIIDGYTQTLLHNPNYFLLTKGVLAQEGRDKFPGFSKVSLRGILWGVFYGKGSNERFVADTEDYFSFGEIAKAVLGQPRIVTVAGVNGPETYSMASSYIKSHIPGILYSPMGQAVNIGNGSAGVESVQLAKRIMDFITSPRQHAYTISVLLSLINAGVQRAGTSEPARVLEELAELYPSFELEEEFIERIMSLTANGEDVYGDEVLSEQAKKYTQVMTKFVRDLMLARSEALSKETIVMSEALARGKYEYSGGRLGFVKQGKLYTHGVTRKLMFTNGLIDIEVQDDIKADVICYSRLKGAPTIFKPIVKRF